MTFRIDWTDNAFNGAMAIADHLALHTAIDPEGWIDRLFERVRQLEPHPRLGPPWARATDPSLRQLIYAKKWIVIYRVDDELQAISVLAVRHCAQQPLEPEDLE